MVAAWSYAVCVNFVPGYRDPADKIGAANIGIVSDETEDGGERRRESSAAIDEEVGEDDANGKGREVRRGEEDREDDEDGKGREVRRESVV